MMICEPDAGSETMQEPDGRTPVPVLSQDIVAMIAHELRSPLSVMSNILSICEAISVPAAMPTAGDMLNRQVKKALRLVNELMDLSRFSEERLHCDTSTVDFRRVVLDAVQDVGQEIRTRRQTLALDVLSEALWVQGDENRLQQIVGNLLENSCKYSSDGGRILLILRREESQAVLHVSDDGVGIASEDLPRIFDPYFRGRGAAQAPRNGLGLGLTLTRRLVQLHGGTIEAKSRGVGCGSEFTVMLPTATDPR